MGKQYSIAFKDQSVDAYLAPAENKSAPGVLVLHAWWGLNDFMRGFCDRLAAEGFTALAPDLYHGGTARAIAEAKTLRNTMDRALAEQEILAAADDLIRSTGGAAPSIGLVGFSLGAFLGMGALEKRPADFGAVVLFYGGRRAKLNKTRAAFLAHFAENDPYVSDRDKQALVENTQQAGLDAEIYEYPGTGHWFFETDRTDAYNAAAADLAWQRTLTFLRGRLIHV